MITCYIYIYFLLYRIYPPIAARCASSVVPVVDIPQIPLVNEPLLGYKKGSKERAEIEKKAP